MWDIKTEREYSAAQVVQNWNHFTESPCVMLVSICVWLLTCRLYHQAPPQALQAVLGGVDANTSELLLSRAQLRGYSLVAVRHFWFSSAVIWHALLV